MSDDKFGLGQLRHMYAQMIKGGIGDQAAAAKHLLAPGIRYAEQLESDLAAARAEVERLKEEFGDYAMRACADLANLRDAGAGADGEPGGGK